MRVLGWRRPVPSTRGAPFSLLEMEEMGRLPSRLHHVAVQTPRDGACTKQSGQCPGDLWASQSGSASCLPSVHSNLNDPSPHLARG